MDHGVRLASSRASREAAVQAPVSAGRYGGGLAVASRFVGAIFIGYAATVGLAALFALILVLLTGISRSEAVTGANLLAYPVWAAFVLWAFAERRLARVWAVLLGVAILSHAMSFAMVPLLPADRPAATGTH